MSNGYYGPPPYGWGAPPMPPRSIKEQVTDAEEGIVALTRFVDTLKSKDKKDDKKDDKKGFWANISERDMRWALIVFSPLTGLLLLKFLANMVGFKIVIQVVAQ